MLTPEDWSFRDYSQNARHVDETTQWNIRLSAYNGVWKIAFPYIYPTLFMTQCGARPRLNVRRQISVKTYMCMQLYESADMRMHLPPLFIIAYRWRKKVLHALPASLAYCLIIDDLQTSNVNKSWFTKVHRPHAPTGYSGEY
jgi:hypothetical protein